MIIYKYAYLINDIKLLDKRSKIMRFIDESYNDIRKLMLWCLFFINNSWYLLIVSPPILQLISFIIWLFWRKIEQKLEKLIILTNEVVTICFLVLIVLSFDWMQLIPESGVKTIAIIMEISMILLLSFELIIIFIKDVTSVKRYYKDLIL